MSNFRVQPAISNYRNNFVTVQATKHIVYNLLTEIKKNNSSLIKSYDMEDSNKTLHINLKDNENINTVIIDSLNEEKNQNIIQFPDTYYNNINIILPKIRENIGSFNFHLLSNERTDTDDCDGTESKVKINVTIQPNSLEEKILPDNSQQIIIEDELDYINFHPLVDKSKWYVVRDY